MAHVTEYAILAILLSMTLAQEGASARAAMFGAVVGACLYAISDEVHQTYVPDRHGSPVDVAIDLVGVAIGSTWAYRRRLRLDDMQIGHDPDHDQ
jgi:VanZ family protein